MVEKSRRQQLEEMLTDDPNDPFLRYGLAMEHLSSGADDDAVRCFRELISVSADYVPAYLQLGQTLNRLGQSTAAGEVFRQGIGVAQRQGDTHAAEEMNGFLTALQ